MEAGAAAPPLPRSLRGVGMWSFSWPRPTGRAWASRHPPVRPRPSLVVHRLGRLLAGVLGAVLGGVELPELGVADEALRLGPLVFAPVAALLGLRPLLGVAHDALVLGDAVFVAPPAGVVVASLVLLGLLVRAGLVGVLLRRLVRLAAAQGEQQQRRQQCQQDAHLRRDPHERTPSGVSLLLRNLVLARRGSAPLRALLEL